VKRFGRHLLIAFFTGLVLAATPVLFSAVDRWESISIASAWLCLAMLCAAMLIGPLRRNAGKPAPISIHLRRDMGIWSALLAFLHFYAGTVVSMDQSYIQTFVSNAGYAPSAEVRDQLFVWGSIAGTVVAFVFIVLLAISSDRAIRWLGSGRWKKVQRCTHLALWLTVLHGIAFQVLEARFVPLVLMVGITLLVYFYRQKHHQTT
jgi:sulfoxide reductase heme-binding subunit YedZ